MTWRDPFPAACWEAKTVSSIIPVEAETPSDGVFRATHSPLPILEREQVEHPEGVVVNEDRLLQAVRDQPADYPVIPILGQSGMGKSHLIRWLRMHLELPSTTRLVFVPKHKTSLRGILEVILQHVPRERSADFWHRVNAAVDSMADDWEARLRLRGELATLIETRGPQPGPYSAEEQELRRYLASSLPALLLDPWFRGALLADKGAIARLVREKLEGKGPGDKEEAFGFTADDVQLSVDDTRKASAAAAEIAGDLAADDELPRLAAKMLNEQLGQAVSNVFGLGGDDLKNLLMELRLDLASREEELLLLIEDFSIFQGIQGGLIDAITLIPSKELPVCPMRVVMAVTTGYFDHHLPDTVKTRTYVAFDLDLSPAVGQQADPADFVAPYLNAVRVGPDALDAAFSSGEKIPNPCPLCPVSVECHRAFGDVDGIGMFPFNRHALERLIRAKEKTEGNFVARDVLNRVLRPILHRERDPLVKGEFPSTTFAQEFATGGYGLLDLEDEAVLTRAADTPETNARRKTLVRFWGDGSGPQNLSPTIHKAFNIPQIDDLPVANGGPGPSIRIGTGARTATGTGTGTGAKLSPPSPSQRASSLPPLVEAVDRWNETGELRQRDQNELRRIVHTLVMERLELEDGFWQASAWADPSKLAPAFPQVAVYLVEPPSTPDSRQAVLKLRRGGSPDARALRALAWHYSVGTWHEVPNGSTLQRLAHNKVEEWASCVSDQLMPSGVDDFPEELIAIVYALDMGARILGLSGAYSEDLADRVSALVDPGPSLEEITSSWLPLQSLLVAAITGGVSLAADRGQLKQRLFRLASFSQDGSPLGLDIPRIAMALRQAEQFMAPSQEIASDLTRHLAILESRLADLDTLGTALHSALPDPELIGPDIREAITELDNLLARALTGDLLPPGVDPTLLRQAGRAVKDGDSGTVAKARQGLTRWEELSRREKLRLVTGGWFPSSNRIQAWMTAADVAVSALEARLTAGPGVRPEVDLVATRALAAVEKSVAALDRLLEDGETVIA